MEGTFWGFEEGELSGDVLGFVFFWGKSFGVNNVLLDSNFSQISNDLSTNGPNVVGISSGVE